MILSIQNTSKRKGGRIWNFLKIDAKMKVSRDSIAIHLEEWARHFECEYIIKLSKKDLVPYHLNRMLNSDKALALFRQTQALSRHEHDFQQVSYPACFLSQPWQKLHSYHGGI